jgi:hypothetical protein
LSLSGDAGPSSLEYDSAGSGFEMVPVGIAPPSGAPLVSHLIAHEQQHQQQPGVDSLDLTRLVASLLVGPAGTAAAAQRPGEQQRIQAAAEMADLGLGGDSSLLAAEAPSLGAVAAPVQFWRRSTPGSTRMIALTSPDQQEVMLAIHRSNPSI